MIPQPQKDRLLRPCHNGYFEIEEGRPTAGPPRRPLPRIKLEVKNGGIYAKQRLRDGRVLNPQTRPRP